MNSEFLLAETGWSGSLHTGHTAGVSMEKAESCFRMQEKKKDGGKDVECREFSSLEVNDQKGEARDPGAARHGKCILYWHYDQLLEVHTKTRQGSPVDNRPSAH